MTRPHRPSPSPHGFERPPPMTLHALLEDFATAHARPPGGGAPEPALAEEERLAAFDRGYGEGYDDATAAAEAERRQVGAALAGRLQDLSFTYHEARVAVIREVRELIAAIGDGVLPALGREGFGAALAEAVGAGIEGRAACPVAVSVAPEAVDLVAPLMPEVEGFPVELRADPDLGEGQAVIGFPDGERELDMAPVVERALAALSEWIAEGRDGAPASEDGPHEDTQPMEAAHG